VRYGDAEPDIIRTMVKLCKERGLRPGIHWPFEETHWLIWTIGRFNLEHPQFWGRTVDGKPWWGRVSLAFEPVVQHKLRLVDELLDRGVECLFLDFRRNGGWGPHVEYVEPLVASYRQKHGEAPPADSTDLRWVQHVCENVTAYMRRLRDHVKQRNPKCELMVGLPNIAPIGDQTMVAQLADWRTWVKEGIVDTVVVNNVAWDPKDPMKSTRQLYREVLDFVAGRCRVLMPVMAYDHPYQRGMPGYQKATGRSQEDIAKELALMAWEEGASGVSLECVDYDNYRKPTRDVLKQLRETTCRFAKPPAGSKPAGGSRQLTTHQAPLSSVLASAIQRQPPAGSEPTGGWRQLTDGPGNDTEAAWSPDGRRIAFQSDRAGDLDLFILDLDTRKVTPLVTGPGHACFPAWSPDGRLIVYSFAHFTKTAVEGIENGYNLFIVSADGGTPRRLTSGICRDYSPSFSRDGQRVYFASTHGAKKNSVGLFSVPIEGGEPTPVLFNDSDDTAAVQPGLSPDGRLLAYGFVAGFRSNWSLRLAKASNTSDTFPLTDGDAPFYGPRWSPKDLILACAGYQPGDPGWGVYLVDARTGQRLRVDTGSGNSRSPAWSPDGKSLVFENNQSGRYRLCRVAVPPMPPMAETREERPAGKPVIEFSFEKKPGAAVPDLSGHGNDGRAEGEVAWRDGAVAFAPGAFVSVPAAKGCDFGDGAFSVKATVLVREHTSQLRIIAVGDYPGNRQGWQLYLADTNHAWFNSRDPQRQYRGSRSDAPLPVGRKVTLIGVRDALGRVQLHVDGIRQANSSSGATIQYPVPIQVRLGAQYNGQASFTGQLYDFTLHPRALTRSEISDRSLAEFLAR
ncbi:MAG: hypothetical protein FJ279_24620, partial [Planctomycetes bacterium]|nr:hypothetical protein [Planctomycetota bacterium]